jgi:AbrB family looped-hinge helix DNA binding protein
MREMTTPVKVDKQGRVTIPPIVRETLSIEGGDVVEITVRKMDITEKEKSQSLNPLMAAETLVPIPA